MSLLDLKLKPSLKPQDFKAKLYFGLIDNRLWKLLPRVEIEWGQSTPFKVPVTETAIYIGAGVYDRPEGGESLGEGYIMPEKKMWAGDAMLVTLRWPRNK
jgi:hypothetical protein